MSSIQSSALNGQEPVGQTLIIPIGNRDPAEYAVDLHHAIAKLKMLAFEQREIDLNDDQAFALYMLSEFQIKLVDK